MSTSYGHTVPDTTFHVVRPLPLRGNQHDAMSIIPAGHPWPLAAAMEPGPPPERDDAISLSNPSRSIDGHHSRQSIQEGHRLN